MTKYVTHGYVADDVVFDPAQAVKTLTIVENVETAIDTGLVDANGVKLYRLPERGPFGFTGRLK
jgi:hypothetical protein